LKKLSIAVPLMSLTSEIKLYLGISTSTHALSEIPLLSLIDFAVC